MITVNVQDGQEGSEKLRINSEGAAHVVSHTHPPLDESINTFPFRSYFMTTAGSRDMRVNGSASSVEFSISARPDRDIWIKTISVRISDNGAKLDKFGALAELTNGVLFDYNTISLGSVIIHEGLKTNLSFLRLGVNSPAIGGVDAFKADLSGGGADTYLPVIDIAGTFGMQFGLRLVKGTKDKLSFTIRDNLSAGLDTFDVIGYGIQI